MRKCANADAYGKSSMDIMISFLCPFNIRYSSYILKNFLGVMLKTSVSVYPSFLVPMYKSRAIFNCSGSSSGLGLLPHHFPEENSRMMSSPAGSILLQEERRPIL